MNELRKRQIKIANGLIGKTIVGTNYKDGYRVDDSFILLFSDDTFAVIEADWDEDGLTGLYLEDTLPSIYDLMCAGIITEKEFNKLLAGIRERERQQQEARERTQLEQLIKKYGEDFRITQRRKQ